MSVRSRAAWSALALVGFGWLGSRPVEGQARSWKPPVTSFGQPDLQGVWTNNSATPVERPRAFEGRPLLTDNEVTELQRRADRIFKDGRSAFAAGDAVFLAASANLEQYENPNSTANSVWMVQKQFDNRTSLIPVPPGGRVPRLTPAALERQADDAARQRRLSGSEDLSNPLRCITYGIPRFGGRYGDVDFGYFEIVQAPGYVVLMMEAIHDARVIPLDGRPRLSERIRHWNGDSRGRWEGSTLVVETANFSSKSNFMGAAENLHLVERFTRVGPETINYEITLHDPTTWTKPWTVVIPLRQSHDRLYEFACHEGNQSMVGILAGARAEEQAAERVRSR